MSDLETSRRRAAYRASHRGTKEMDILLGRYADDWLPKMDADQLARFERFLELPDPELQAAILAGQADKAVGYAELVAALRRQYGLDGSNPRS